MSLPFKNRNKSMQQELNQKTKVGNLEVYANAQDGEVWVTGFSDYKNLEKIFKNLNEWLSTYYHNPQRETNFHFRITCISKNLNKKIFDLLSLIKSEYSDSSINEFYWHFFSDDDEEIQECGSEYKNILDIPIQFVIEDEDEFNQKELNNINQKVSENDLDKAFELFSKYLQRNYKKWKIPIVKEIFDNVRGFDNPMIFTSRHADMFLLSEVETGTDESNEFTIYMIQIIEDTSDLRTNKERFNFYSNARQNTIDAIDDVLSELLPVNVKVVVVGNGSGDSFKDQNSKEFNNEIFSYYQIGDFDTKKILPEKQPGIVSDSFQGFVTELVSYLSSDSDDISSKVSVNNSFNIMDLAPKSFDDFIKGMESIYDKTKNLKDVFSMSFNMAFVSDTLSNVYELTHHMQKMVFWNEDSNIEIKKHNFSDTENVLNFTNFLTNSTNDILIIENIEQDLKAEKNQIAGPTKAELITALCDYLETVSSNIVIVSVTKRGWEKLVNQYPLLRVCFQHIFNFKNYSSDILKKRFVTELSIYDLIAEDEAIKLVTEYFKYLEKTLDPSLFNNTISTMLAREVRYYQTLRVGKGNAIMEKVVLTQDVHNSIKDEYNLSVKKTLPEIMTKLDKLTGLEKVKNNIKDLAALVKVQKLRADHNESTSLNSIFLGNPGTGKTTVAEILGEIYKNIGVLTKGHIVSVKRHDIVEQYIGYTARNMKQLLDRARGGILFIDEAYALYRPDNDRDFGIEAIDTLVAELENVKDTTCVIMAGYPDKMKLFLDSNPGLASRFPNVTMFDDYSALELDEIFNNFVSRAKYKLDKEVDTIVSDFINEIVQEKDKFFGNARECRNIVEKLKLIHASRIIYKEQTEESDLNTFTKEDVQKLISIYKLNHKQRIDRKMIGYKSFLQKSNI